MKRSIGAVGCTVSRSRSLESTPLSMSSPVWIQTLVLFHALIGIMLQAELSLLPPNEL